MVEIYDTHEQSERVKGWLRENGGAIVMGLVLAFGGLFGFKQWQSWNVHQSQKASAEYEMLTELLTEDKLDDAVANFETLKAEFPKSPYTVMAAMQMAKSRVQADQPDLAVGLLEHAMKHGNPQALRVIARERLARVKLHMGDADAALSLLDGAPSELGFEAQFEEIRGDAYRAKGDLAAAAEHYSAALDALEAGTGNRPYLEVKLKSVRTNTASEGKAS